MSDDIVTYVSRRAPGFTVTIRRASGKWERFKCENGVLSIPASDTEAVLQIDQAIATAPAVAQNLAKIDRAAAEAHAAAFARKVASKGSFGSDTIMEMRREVEQASGAAREETGGTVEGMIAAAGAVIDENAIDPPLQTEHVRQEVPPAPKVLLGGGKA